MSVKRKSYDSLMGHFSTILSEPFSLDKNNGVFFARKREKRLLGRFLVCTILRRNFRAIYQYSKIIILAGSQINRSVRDAFNFDQKADSAG
jgi:hypothetical protein